MQNVVISIVDIIDRLKAAQGHCKDADLARDLAVPPKKLAVWKLRNTIPLEELTTFCRRYNYNLEWALTGVSKDDSATGGKYSVLEEHHGEEYLVDRVVNKKLRSLTEKLTRIVFEQNEKKIRAVEAQLDLLDPGVRQPIQKDAGDK